MRKNILGLGLILLTVSCFAQDAEINRNINLGVNRADFSLENLHNNKRSLIGFNADSRQSLFSREVAFATSKPAHKPFNRANIVNGRSSFREKRIIKNNYVFNGSSSVLTQEQLTAHTFATSNNYFDQNRRNIYSSLWAFASLNYLYADLVGLMDAQILSQYQAGVVDGTRITPQFLTIAAGFMQISLANVFLPQVIKNERTLRWVQIASGTIMTLVQSGTLLVGKPTPYYALFSAIEIGTTGFLTINAIKWKPNCKKRSIPENN